MKAVFTSLVVASAILLSSGAALAATTHYDSLALWEADVVDYTLEDFTAPNPLGLGYTAGPVTQYTDGIFTLFAGEGPVTIEFFSAGDNHTGYGKRFFPADKKRWEYNCFPL